MPAMIFSRVDFPQPDGPTILTNLPSPTVRLMSWRTTKSSPDPGLGKRFVRLSTVMADDAVAFCLTGSPAMAGAIPTR